MIVAIMKFALAFMLFSNAVSADSIRIKDLVSFDGVRGNDLIGYGLAVGLNGTGDGLRNSPFTEEIMANVLERLGVNISGEQFRPKNVAAVLVTATLPPFARAGGQIPVSVSAIGDAKSLLGGTLVMTPLNAADGEIYAVAQGSILSGGSSVQGQAASIVQGVPTTGTIPAGARIEREIDFDLSSLKIIRLGLKNPDFTTAEKIEKAINREFGRNISAMIDAGTVSLDLEKSSLNSPAHVIGRIENLTVDPEQRARVVIDQRSGTIVIGEDVRISRVAVSQGNLTLRVQERPEVMQPNPFSLGASIIVPRTGVALEDQSGIRMAEIPAASSLSDVVSGLNALGVSPRDMIDIMKSIYAAGAIYAEFIIQ